MANNKFNFFIDSPNLKHPNMRDIRDVQINILGEVEQAERPLFQTPPRLNNIIGASPLLKRGPYFSHQEPLQKRKRSEELGFIEGFSPPDQLEEQDHQFGIDDRVQFTPEEHEDLLSPINATPIKNVDRPQGLQDGHQFSTTMKKQGVYQTPGAESRATERGLKRLAYEAYTLVTSNQKRTSYKQVAKKLIADLTRQDDNDNIVRTPQMQKSNEMNIKRRVYDALNVLIALGVLKRFGNRITGKKSELDEFMSTGGDKDKQVLRERQQAQERDLLKKQFARKQKILEAKRKCYRDMKFKLENMRQLTRKNMAAGEPGPTEQICEQQRKMKFPIIAICSSHSEENPEEHFKYEESVKMEEEDSAIHLWQENIATLSCSFSTSNKMEVMGEFDLMGLWKKQGQKSKSDKTKKKRQ